MSATKCTIGSAFSIPATIQEAIARPKTSAPRTHVNTKVAIAIESSCAEAKQAVPTMNTALLHILLTDQRNKFRHEWEWFVTETSTNSTLRGSARRCRAPANCRVLVFSVLSCWRAILIFSHWSFSLKRWSIMQSPPVTIRWYGTSGRHILHCLLKGNWT